MRKSTPIRAATLLTAIAAGALALTAVAPAHDDDRFPPDQEAGRVASFDEQTDVLTIALADGGTISGTVTRFTWVKCDDRDFSRGARRHLSDGQHDWDDDHRGWRARCSTDALTDGAVVEDALVSLRDGQAFFWKVELTS